MKKQIAGIRFHKGGRIYYFDALEFNLKKGNMVLVDTSFGKEAGEVVNLKTVADMEANKDYLPVIKVFDEEDYKVVSKQNKEREKYLKTAVEMVGKSGLDMKILDINFGFDDNKLTFIFSSESRVDFRQLVKDLSTKFKKQIVLRQIGPRDAARLLGGYGRCGRKLCCEGFLQNLESITMDMAKHQNLASKGASKISGVCGKLMCCLAYEVETYKQLVKNLPEMGEKIKTKEGIGRVIDQNIIKQTVLVELEKNGRKMEISFKDEE